MELHTNNDSTYYKYYDKWYKIIFSTYSSQNANDFLMGHKDCGVLNVEGGHIVIAKKDDEGIHLKDVN